MQCGVIIGSYKNGSSRSRLLDRDRTVLRINRDHRNAQVAKGSGDQLLRQKAAVFTLCAERADLITNLDFFQRAWLRIAKLHRIGSVPLRNDVRSQRDCLLTGAVRRCGGRARDSNRYFFSFRIDRGNRSSDASSLPIPTLRLPSIGKVCLRHYNDRYCEHGFLVIRDAAANEYPVSGADITHRYLARSTQILRAGRNA